MKAQQEEDLICRIPRSLQIPGLVDSLVPQGHDGPRFSPSWCSVVFAELALIFRLVPLRLKGGTLAPCISSSPNHTQRQEKKTSLPCVSFEEEDKFSQKSLSRFSLCLIGQNGVTCSCLNQSLTVETRNKVPLPGLGRSLAPLERVAA